MDSVRQFLKEFSIGNVQGALESVILSPKCQYDELQTLYPHLLRAVVNYADASVFSAGGELLIANSYLIEVLKKDPEPPPETNQALSLLDYERVLLLYLNLPPKDFFESVQTNPVYQYLYSERTVLPLDEKEWNRILAAVPRPYDLIIKNQREMAQNLCLYRKFRPDFVASFRPTYDFSTRPWHALRYKIKFESSLVPELKPGETPLIFLDPLEGDMKPFLESFKGRPVIFAFETKLHFIQMLQYSEALEAFLDEQHLIYIFDMYPNEQLKAQGWQSVEGISLRPIVLTDRPLLREVLPLFIQALEGCLAQKNVEFEGADTPVADWLYEIGRRHVFRTREYRLGYSRIAALIEFDQQIRWHDPHKGLPKAGLPLGPPSLNYFDQYLHKLSRERRERAPSQHGKIRIAHVVPQLVAGGHAPTLLLTNILKNSDTSKFELYLITTERMVHRDMEYPFLVYSTPHTNVRAKDLVHQLHLENVFFYQADDKYDYEATARGIAQLLSHHKIDAAIFHGPDVINTICAQITDVPLRAMFEHGTPPSYPGFDVAVMSTEEDSESYRIRMNELGTKLYSLPFVLDARKSWEEKAPTKESLGFPVDSFIMTTISNNIEHRLTHEMAQAVAAILQINPKAYYAPMGDFKDPERVIALFDKYGVGDRVVLRGRSSYPSQVARGMDLYLNEFPFGSCLGMLDGMASGMPVVSMYDKNGPKQARYGGAFLGLDRVITSCKREEYVELACRLISDKAMYEEWRRHTLKAYEQHVDIEGYMKTFEGIILDNL